MDHKRGHHLLDQAKHAVDYAARKRQKDISHAPSTSNPLLRFEGPPIGCALRTTNNVRALMMHKNELEEYNNPGYKSMREMDKTVEDTAYKKLLPVVKRELECKRDMHMAQSRRGVKRPSRSDKEDKICAICPYPKRFKGWDALLIHAEKFNKENERQHRGYFRALKEALQEDQIVSPKHGFYKGASPREGSTGDLSRVGWKPNILIVENNKLSELEQLICPRLEHVISDDGRHAGMLTVKSARPQLKEILAVYSTGNNNKRNVFVFPATEVGYIDGRELKDTCHLEQEVGFHCNDHQELVNKPEKTNSTYICSMTLATGLKNRKDKFGLKLLPEADVYDKRGKLFDDNQFDRIKKIVTRWSNSIHSINRKFEMQRSFCGGRKMHDLDQGWQEDLKRIEWYTPATKKKVREQMTAIEVELRKGNLVWLQEVEAVREQFQRLADNMKREEEASSYRNLRREEESLKKQKKLELERMRLENYRRMQALKSVKSSKKSKHAAEGQLLVETWTEEYTRLRRDSHKAKLERIRLQAIHERVHYKAFLNRKRECPICFEQLRKDFAKDIREPFSQFYPVSKLCLNLTCQKRH